MDSYFSRKTAIDVLLRIQRRVWDADVPGPYEEHHARMQGLINYIQAEMLRIKDGDSVEPSGTFTDGYVTAMKDVIETTTRIAEDRTDRLIVFAQETYESLTRTVEKLAEEAERQRAGGK